MDSFDFSKKLLKDPEEQNDFFPSENITSIVYFLTLAIFFFQIPLWGKRTVTISFGIVPMVSYLLSGILITPCLYVFHRFSGFNGL